MKVKLVAEINLKESICGTELEYFSKYVHFIHEAFHLTLIRRIRQNEKEIQAKEKLNAF